MIKKLSPQREQERDKMKKVLKEIKKRYPRDQGSTIPFQYLIWYDTQNHTPQGCWYIATTCFWTYFMNPTYLKVVERLLKKYGVKQGNIIITHKSVHDIKRGILKNKQLIKVL